MKLKDMTVGQRILYKHYSRVWNSRCDAMWAINNLGDIDKRLVDSIDREIRKVAAAFWNAGLAERGFDHEFNRPKKPAKKGAKRP